MLKNINRRNILWMCICTLAGFLALTSAIFMVPVNHHITGLVQVVCAVVLYFCIVIFVADWNWLDIRAVFAGAWLATIGLATLRLAAYQEPWQAKTWILVALAYVVFQIGATAGLFVGDRIYSGALEKVRKIKLGKIRFELQSDRLFLICVLTTLIGLTCFAINVKIKGFIPCFSDDVNAYMYFYTKFHVFAVAATSVSGLCYYCIKTQPLSIVKKITLLLCIFYLVFLFPILVVSRGVFMVAAVSLTVSIFYLHRKKIVALVLSLVVILGVYLFTSSLRNYTDDQLNIFFEPAEITLSAQPTETSEPVPTVPSETIVPSEVMVPSETIVPSDPSTTGQASVFVLPPKAAFVYSYLTVSHDNFNLAVKNTQNFTYGVRQLAPFNVILRSDWISEKINAAEYYQVNLYLNTANLLGDFYYDFGSAGVAIMTLLWAFVFGVMQAAYEKKKGPFAMLVLGNAMVPVLLCFFASWLTNFTQWMLWGVVLIYALIACVTTKEASDGKE